MSPTSTDAWLVPELGPSLGRLADPPVGTLDRGPLDLVLDDIRLDLVTRLFETAGAARSFAATGDRQGAIASLSRVAWLALWERAVAAAADRLAEIVNARLADAARESRLPPQRLKKTRTPRMGRWSASGPRIPATRTAAPMCRCSCHSTGQGGFLR